MARFVGKEEAIVFNMGYATNSTTIPALVRGSETIRGGEAEGQDRGQKDKRARGTQGLTCFSFTRRHARQSYGWTLPPFPVYRS